MSDIFISYSSKDRAEAEQLLELLASAGLSCWMDKAHIEVSSSWSKEIVQAIDQCSAFVVLLSEASNESTNVHKEVSLAAEKRKKILPLDLEPIVLSEDLQYHLAGIQRAPMTNIDAILRALGRLGLEATQAPTMKLVKETDSRKSLMILPFEDLSPTGDNQWFADGIVAELIAALSHVRALRVTDQQTTKEYKSYKGQMTVYAREMGIRYFVQGSIRKFGDQIKISSTLLDIESGEHLWQDSLKGTMEDIFAIQETVAKKVVDALHIILTREEEKHVAEKPTENAEAYELWLKGQEYYDRQTRPDFERALGLYEEAARIDPGFGKVQISLALSSLEYYRQYSRDVKWIVRANEHIAKAELLLGQSKNLYWIRSILAHRLGKYEEALHLGERVAELDPEFAFAFSAIGFAYHGLGMQKEAANAFKRNVELNRENRTSNFNYLVMLKELGDTSQLIEAARKSLPLFERYRRLTPNDQYAHMQYANVLAMTGEHDLALFEARKIEEANLADGNTLYDLACLYLLEGMNDRAISALKKAVEQGYRRIEDFRRDPDLEPLRGTPEFEELMKQLEQKIAGE